MKKRLITCALPYVNNVPHLGTLLQVLSADVFARFCRLRGYETLYVCGTDEYGTATETKALEEHVTPQELCDRFHKIHADVYSWFNISFDRFGRTSTEKQTEITQHLFYKLDEAGYIKERTIEQLYCETCDRFLADRYVHGTCPHCGYEDARGDQCDNCGKLLDPTELINPRCGICGETPVLRTSKHLYLDLPAILPKLSNWIGEASVKGFWANNAIQMTKSWIRDGLKERGITRDLKWGIPVPKPGYEDKVFYVWFDAPIGYISITANHTGQWEAWWRDPDNVKLFQFIGKDNIPFHTVIFPSTLIGSGETWTMLHHMSSSEYLNYEGTKFSKSRGTGVFGSDAMETGIPADVWRFYLYYNRPEKSDVIFYWKDFQEKVNGELIGNLGNLVNRTLTFVHRFFGGKLARFAGNDDFWVAVENYEQEITNHLERCEIRDAFRAIFALSSLGNKEFQEQEPWKLRTEDPDKAHALLTDLVYLIKDLSILLEPFLPAASQRIREVLGLGDLEWKDMGKASLGKELIIQAGKPEILFTRLEDEQIDFFRKKYGGEQATDPQPPREEAPAQSLSALGLDLRVAKVSKVEPHPAADKLYVLNLILDQEERQIVSGIREQYNPDELLNRHIILVYNLKPAKLRGIKSEGMLLAASAENALEVLFADAVAPGTKLYLEGEEPVAEQENKRLKIDEFTRIPMHVQENRVLVGEEKLMCGGRELTTTRIVKGKVG